MGNKIGSDWTVESITPEGECEVMATAGNVYVAKAAYDEAKKHRPGRVIRLLHGAMIVDQVVGRYHEYWLDGKRETPMVLPQRPQRTARELAELVLAEAHRHNWGRELESVVIVPVDGPGWTWNVASTRPELMSTAASLLRPFVDRLRQDFDLVG